MLKCLEGTGGIQYNLFKQFVERTKHETKMMMTTVERLFEIPDYVKETMQNVCRFFQPHMPYLLILLKINFTVVCTVELMKDISGFYCPLCIKYMLATSNYEIKHW